MSWQTILLAVINPLLGAGLIALLRLWHRNKAVEQTLYGQPGEPGLVMKFESLKAEVKDRDHATRGRMQEAVSEVEERIRDLERVVPKRRSEL